MLAKGSQRPFVTKIVLLGVLILDKSVVLLVDGVVCQMHVLVLLVDFLSVGLGGKSGQPLLKHIDSERLIASDQNINAQIKLVAVNQQRICDVLADNRGLIHVDVVDIVHNVDATALASVCWLHNPNVLLGLMLLELLVMIVEISELIRQDVRVWTEVKSILSESFLKSDNIEAKTVLASDFVTLGEMIDLLILVETLILVALA